MPIPVALRWLRKTVLPCAGQTLSVSQSEACCVAVPGTLRKDLRGMAKGSTWGSQHLVTIFPALAKAPMPTGGMEAEEYL